MLDELWINAQPFFRKSSVEGAQTAALVDCKGDQIAVRDLPKSQTTRCRKDGEQSVKRPVNRARAPQERGSNRADVPRTTGAEGWRTQRRRRRLMLTKATPTAMSDTAHTLLRTSSEPVTANAPVVELMISVPST